QGGDTPVPPPRSGRSWAGGRGGTVGASQPGTRRSGGVPAPWDDAGTLLGRPRSVPGLGRWERPSWDTPCSLQSVTNLLGHLDVAECDFCGHAVQVSASISAFFR